MCIGTLVRFEQKTKVDDIVDVDEYDEDEDELVDNRLIEFIVELKRKGMERKKTWRP